MQVLWKPGLEVKADSITIMHEGVIKAEGSPEKIKSSDEIREAFLGI